MERRSPGLMMGGVVLTTVGGVSMVSAGVLASTAAACGGCSTSDQNGKATVALVMLIVGAVCAVAGVPMIVSGGKRVPLKKTHEPEALRGGVLRF